jgi:hypothetical protein
MRVSKWIYVVIAFLLVFFSDIPLKKYNHHKLCKFESGTTIFEKPKVNGFLEKNPNDFNDFDIPEFSSSHDCSPVCKLALRNLFIRNGAGEALFDENVFINVLWDGVRGARYLKTYEHEYEHPNKHKYKSKTKYEYEYEYKSAKLWIDESTSPYCLANLLPRDFIEYCGEGCVRNNKCVAGERVEGVITPYVIENGRKDLNGINEQYTVIKNTELKSYAAKTSTFTYIGGWFHEFLGNVFHPVWGETCANLPRFDTEERVIKDFFN